MSIKFHIPDFWSLCSLNLNLIDMIKEHPEYFHDGVEIASVYGCFPPSVWNGGRNINGYAREDEIKDVLEYFNSRGVPCRFTFTNPLITEEHLSDEYCNRIMELADNGLNEVIVNKQFLEDYIREKYPKYKITSSTCKQIRDFDALMAEFEKDYSLVVLDYNWNNKMEDMEKIPEKYRSRAEILVCPYCYPNCKRRGEHYEFLGDQQIRMSTYNTFRGQAGITSGMNIRIDEQFECDAPALSFPETIKFSTHVTPETMYEKYVPLGYNQFKIEGRTLHPLNVIESYAYYMAKPEYKDLVRLKLGLSVFRM